MSQVKLNEIKGFTLIELLVVIAIIVILAVIALLSYNGFVKKAECGGHKEQHRKVVNLANETYGFCRLNGSTYMNSPPGYTCRSNSKAGTTYVSGDGYTTKCVKKWDCRKVNYFGNKVTAGSNDVMMMYHVAAEFGQPMNTDGFVRNDQWQNFIKPNYPARAGITNIRGKGDILHIATYLGSDCSGGNFTNSAGSYLIDEITWP
jgi:prepilin-type N-terminal cleavage/methylation domain-containing protein